MHAVAPCLAARSDARQWREALARVQELEDPSPELREKIRQARAQHKVIDVTQEALVFDTAAESAGERLEVDEWDTRFSRSRDSQGR